MTFRLVSAISRNETGITSRYLEIIWSLVSNLLRNNWRILHGRAATRNLYDLMMNLKLQNAVRRSLSLLSVT